MSAAEAGYEAAFTTMEDNDEEVAPLANAAAAAGAGLKNQLLLGWRRGKAPAFSAAAAPVAAAADATAAAAAARSASRCGSST